MPRKNRIVIIRHNLEETGRYGAKYKSAELTKMRVEEWPSVFSTWDETRRRRKIYLSSKQYNYNRNINKVINPSTLAIPMTIIHKSVTLVANPDQVQ